MHEAQSVLASARAELARFPVVLDALLKDLDPGAWRARPAAAEWAPVEIFCHLRDEEVEDFGARLRVVLEGGERFTPIDPERWASERRYLEDDGPRALADFRERRAASLVVLASIAPAGLSRIVQHARTGGLSGLDILAAWVEHDRLHLAQLAATMARDWATRWTGLHTEYAGPVPYGARLRREIEQSLGAPVGCPAGSGRPGGRRPALTAPIVSENRERIRGRSGPADHAQR